MLRHIEDNAAFLESIMNGEENAITEIARMIEDYDTKPKKLSTSFDDERTESEEKTKHEQNHKW